MLLNNDNIAKYTILPTDYNYDEIWNYVNIAEIEYIKPLISEDTYNNFTEDAPEPVLQYLGMQVSQLVLPIIALKVSDKGITRNNSEYSSKATLNEISYLEVRINSTINLLYKAFIKYLKDNNLLISNCSSLERDNIYSFPFVNTNIH